MDDFARRRSSRHASIGDVPLEVVRRLRTFEKEELKRTHSESDVDPLKRFEYLRNGKATSVMIRATPNAVRWDEINRVQYRFQALNFHSDVLEALIHNSPPLSRREHSAAAKANYERNLLRNLDDDNNGDLSSDDESDTNNNDMEKKATRRVSLSRQAKTLRRANSYDAGHDFERKGSVVQVSPKDDTSDYNSDEEVFHGRSDSGFENISYNATICHVKTGRIKDTAQIQVTSCNKPVDCTKINEGNMHLLADSSIYSKDTLRKSSSAPSTRKVSTVMPESLISERFQSERDNLDYLSNEELNSKSKEELVELVRSLQRELETTKHESYQRQHSSPLHSPSIHSPVPHSPTHSRFITMKVYSRQQSINEEGEEKESSESKLPNVNSLIQSFEQRTIPVNESNPPHPHKLRKDQR